MIDADVDLRSIEAALRRVTALGRDPRAIFRAARKPVLDDQREHRARQAGPDGRWPRRAASTLLRYRQDRRAGKKRGSKVLGRLPTALSVVIDRARLLVTSKVRWSMAHQQGRGRLPARTFLWISETLTRRLRDLVVSMAESEWNG